MLAFAFLEVVNIICISNRINLFKLYFVFNSKQFFSQILSIEFCLANSKRNQTMCNILPVLIKEKKYIHIFLISIRGQQKVKVCPSCANILVDESIITHSHNRKKYLRCKQVISCTPTKAKFKYNLQQEQKQADSQMVSMHQARKAKMQCLKITVFLKPHCFYLMGFCPLNLQREKS